MCVVGWYGGGWVVWSWYCGMGEVVLYITMVVGCYSCGRVVCGWQV